MEPCRHLDHDPERYPSCELIKIDGFSCEVKHFLREAPHEGAATKVQFCNLRGRIPGIFQCYNEGEMHCYESLGACGEAADPVERCPDCDGAGVTGTSPDSPPCGTCEPELRAEWIRAGRAQSRLDNPVSRMGRGCENCGAKTYGRLCGSCAGRYDAYMEAHINRENALAAGEVEHLPEGPFQEWTPGWWTRRGLLSSPSRKPNDGVREDDPDEPTGHGVEDLACAQEDADRATLDVEPDDPDEQIATRYDCTCLGACRGASGLAPQWRCVLETDPGEQPAESDASLAKASPGWDNFPTCVCGFRGPGAHFCPGKPTTGRKEWSSEEDGDKDHPRPTWVGSPAISDGPFQTTREHDSEDALDQRRAGHELQGEARGKESAEHLFGQPTGPMVERAKTKADLRVEANARRLGLVS